MIFIFGDPLDKVLRVARKARAGKGERRTVLGERFGVEVSGVLRDSSTSLRMTDLWGEGEGDSISIDTTSNEDAV